MRLLNNKGFTLIECMVVLSLLLMTATLCYSAFSWLTHALVRMQLEHFCATCVYLQEKAQTINKDITLYCDLENNTYTYQGRMYQLPFNVAFGFLPGAYGPGQKPIVTPCTFVQNTIVFYASGIVSSGTLYLVDSSHERMYALSNAVGHVSYIRLYRYDGTWQLI